MCCITSTNFNGTRSIFNLDFPLAHIVTDNVTASELFPIVWEGVRHLENSGFKVIGITANGASPNRIFLECT